MNVIDARDWIKEKLLAAGATGGDTGGNGVVGDLWVTINGTELFVNVALSNRELERRQGAADLAEENRVLREAVGLMTPREAEGCRAALEWLSRAVAHYSAASELWPKEADAERNRCVGSLQLLALDAAEHNMYEVSDLLQRIADVLPLGLTPEATLKLLHEKHEVVEEAPPSPAVLDLMEALKASLAVREPKGDSHE